MASAYLTAFPFLLTSFGNKSPCPQDPAVGWRGNVAKGGGMACYWKILHFFLLFFTAEGVVGKTPKKH
jgi:hypothetical protein